MSKVNFFIYFNIIKQKLKVVVCNIKLILLNIKGLKPLILKGATKCIIYKNNIHSDKRIKICLYIFEVIHMTKISKNIKKLRTAQNMSQEALAEKLFISRQAVSSWENNRTQPDIEMIGKLSELFGVSIEELIYGEKPKTHLDNEDKSPSNKVLIVVFSILGSLLIAGGVIFFIIFGWDKFNIVA